MSRVALVVNQDSSRVARRMSTLRKLARSSGIRMKMCDGPDLDYTIRQALAEKGLKRLIIGGGDGSVSLAASLILRENPKVELAILPLGTSNYYAKSLRVPKNLNKAFSSALQGGVEKRHLCKANKQHFLLGLNIGLASVMFEQVTDAEKSRLGKLAYVRGIYRNFAEVQPPDVVIKANGKTYNYVSAELVVLNQHIVEPVKLMPEVKGTDANFEIFTYGLGKSKLSPLFALLVFAVSAGRNTKYLKRIKTTKATISTTKPQPVAIDGDSLGQTPVEVEVIKKPVKFVRGESGQWK